MTARFVPNAVGVSLARNRRSPKLPSEPRPSGVHPEEDGVEMKMRSLTAGVDRSKKVDLGEVFG